jgi:cytochrome c oxidase cbb3-type subunit 4
MDVVLFHSIWTVLLLVLFIGIWAWAWSKRRKNAFDAAAHLPFEDDVQVDTTPGAVDNEVNLPTHRGENNHG